MLRSKLCVVMLVAVVLACLLAGSHSEEATLPGCPRLKFTFRRAGDARLRLSKRLIAPAQHSGQAYSFTSPAIAKVLLEAHQRGVNVEVILDKSNLTEKYSSADFLAHGGIHTLIDAAHAIAHNKIIIIDGAVVITGSFNFATAAEEHNAENLLIIRDGGVAKNTPPTYCFMCSTLNSTPTRLASCPKRSPTLPGPALRRAVPPGQNKACLLCSIELVTLGFAPAATK